MRGADAGGGGTKIGFNTNHYMRSHIRGRGAGAGAKSAPQQIGPTSNFPRPLRNRALQTIFVLKQIRPRPLRICVNIPRDNAAGISKSARLRSATAPLTCEGTFTHSWSGGGRSRRKIGFNTNHYMRSHIRGRGVEAERGQNPLRNKWVQYLIFRVGFETAPSLRTIFVLNKWQIRPRLLRVCVDIPVVAERKCQNPPVSAP